VTLLASVIPISECLFIDPRFTKPTAGDKYESHGAEDDDDPAFVKLIETKYV
jgi:hypothetical protein